MSKLSNVRVGMIAGAIAVSMVGVSFAAVPLYRIFCQVTGFGGTTMMIDEAKAATIRPVAGKSVSVRFDANVSRNLAWEFKPTETQRVVQIGARNMSVYTAKSLSSEPLKGTATFNVTPVQAGQYFHKVQCFCFTEQVLNPGQQVQMPVVFYVDPRILEDPATRDITEITLSYTFYPVEQPGSGS